VDAKIRVAEGPAREFSTGATRQNASGKGMPVLTCPYADDELAKHFEGGAVVHGPRNWEKGLPVSEYINSLVRHINAFKRGETDERHDRAILWNAHCLVSTLAKLSVGLLPPELDDMPKYDCQPRHPQKVVTPIGKPGIGKSYAVPSEASRALNKFLSLGEPSGMGCDEALDRLTDIIAEEPEPYRVYVSHTIRGVNGVDATEEEMENNCLLAKAQMVSMRERCPGVDFYVPAEHEDFVHIAHQTGLLSEEQVLAVDCDIIDTCDCVLFLNTDNFFSRGMTVERAHAGASDVASMVFTHSTSTGKLYIGDEHPAMWINRNSQAAFKRGGGV
jgi:hypothetical protein